MIDGDNIRLLKRRVIIGNLMGYAGMVGAIVIFFRDAPTHPLWYAFVGVAVGSGVGLAWLSLWKMRNRVKSPNQPSNISQ